MLVKRKVFLTCPMVLTNLHTKARQVIGFDTWQGAILAWPREPYLLSQPSPGHHKSQLSGNKLAAAT